MVYSDRCQGMYFLHLKQNNSNSIHEKSITIHHTDEEREYAYDRGSPVGGLDAGLESAAAGGWTVVDMKSDWKTIYP